MKWILHIILAAILIGWGIWMMHLADRIDKGDPFAELIMRDSSERMLKTFNAPTPDTRNKY
jgi:hypothetical protein